MICFVRKHIMKEGADNYSPQPNPNQYSKNPTRAEARRKEGKNKVVENITDFYVASSSAMQDGSCFTEGMGVHVGSIKESGDLLPQEEQEDYFSNDNEAWGIEACVAMGTSNETDNGTQDHMLWLSRSYHYS